MKVPVDQWNSSENDHNICVLELLHRSSKNADRC
jgi:hypothetical protein